MKRCISDKFVFLVIVLSLINESFCEDQPPFCSQCECQSLGGNGYDVQCTKGQINEKQLFDVSSYPSSSSSDDDTTTSSSYYKKLTIQNTYIPYLNKQFPAANNLILLNLSNNSILNISDNVFCQLQDMKILFLSHNNIEIIHPEAFHGQYVQGRVYPLKSLTVLHLSYNRIHSLDADIFEHAEGIEELDLSHNPLKIIDAQTSQAISSLQNLKNLDISYTEIAALPDYLLHTPRYLSILDISGNHFDSIPLALKLANNLQYLFMNNNPIQNLTAQNGFPRMENLTVLHMRQMSNLKNVGEESLSKLIKLEELYISDSAVEEISKNALSSRKNGSLYETWPPIKKLHLNNNKLTHLDMHLLVAWGDLTELDLTDNPWTCECENQWFIDELMPIYIHLNQNDAKLLKCAAPIEMIEFTMYEIMEQEKSMRCLDKYGHRPERDGGLLIGIFAGVLITIPIILFILYSYKRHWFGLFDNSPASFSRQFYSQTDTRDDF